MLIFQYRIYRNDLRRNPAVLYLFGDNEARYGYGGQAKEMRDEPNAVGVATKRKPSGTASDEFWTDDEYARCCDLLDKDMERAFIHLRAGGVVVCPMDGIGTGLSELPTRAPRIFAYIRDKIRQMRDVPAVSASLDRESAMA